jgi:uncharacterized protein (DUF433 family)
MATTDAPAAGTPITDSPILVVPLRVDAHGTIRIGRTRVTLETVVGTFEQGRTPEEICEDFDTLRVADIYAVIAYYLSNREAVDAYIRRQGEAGEAIRRKIGASRNPVGQRERVPVLQGAADADAATERPDDESSSDALTAMTAGADPVLAALWDNERDAAYDRV